jgi:alpha-L-fucosidase
MKTATLFFLTIFSLLFLFNCNQSPKDYLNESPEEIDARMAWWDEARFGMFIHWGLYAVPAGEYKGEK